MPRERKYASLAERYAERNRRRRERYAATKHQKIESATQTICTIAVTATRVAENTSESVENQLNCSTQDNMLSHIFATETTSALGPENSHNKATSNEIFTTIHTAPPGCAQKRRKIQTDVLGCIATEANILPDAPDCVYCKAKRFHHEPPRFCCASGEIQLLQKEMPRELMLLYLEDSDEAAEFRTCVRSYNNMFAFTSVGVHCDKSLARNNHGIYTFKVQGQIYHFINPLIPPEGANPTNLQLYFFDTEHETTNRLTISSKFKESLIAKIGEILKINPYSAFFRGLQELPNIDDYKVVLESNPDVDQRVFNKPTVSQVGAVWNESDDLQHITSKHIQVYGRNGETQILKHYFGCYDSMQYPLVFAHGEPGWHPGIELLPPGQNPSLRRRNCPGEQAVNPQTYQNAEQIIQAENEGTKKKRKRQTVSCREYYCYKLQIRANDKSMLLHIGRLLQQYVVDMYIKVETTRLDFYRNQDKQRRLRTELYQGLLDSLSKGEPNSSNVGKRIILPASFIGGPRDMRRRYMDAMSLVQRYGKPDIFLTMTCNQNWPEIKQHLLPKQLAQNRPDLLCRVFRAKLELLKHELFKKEIFGKVAAFTYVIEFQKRGLPHAHFLIILEPNSKIFSPEAYDKIVCAELPDQHLHPHLYASVVKHMMHGPCGSLNPESPCMRRQSKCKDNYPKQFADITRHGENSYPIYRRCDNKRAVKIRGCNLDNRWVVPYNPYLLSRFNCHINVEICSTIQAVKYIYKYIYKGHDRIIYQLTPVEANQIFDEIKNFQAARWVSPVEAMWRIFAFELNELHPPVITLPVHLENQQPITFHENQLLQNVIKNDSASRTMLTEFFEMNKHHAEAKKLNCTYSEFPEHFVWHQQSKQWLLRQKKKCIGRVVSVYPSDGERYYLRILLAHVRKPTSFEDLRTVNGQKLTSFRAAAQKLGVLQSDNSAEYCLQEAILYQMPSSLRQLFATILIHCTPQNPIELWLQFQDFLSEDIRQNKSLATHTVQSQVLQCIDHHLNSMGKRLADFGFSNMFSHESHHEQIAKEIQTERTLAHSSEDLATINQLNYDQRVAYDTILQAINNNSQTSFFVDGPAGTGKTFLYKALLATIRSRGEIALATATSGVAASILPGGRTAHSRFKIPLHDSEVKACNIGKQSATAELIRDCKLIIWDEATMAKRQAIETFEELLKDIMNSNALFGGKVVVFGGDFRQTLPVIPKGQKDDIINAALVMSPVWKHLQQLKLHENIRARLDPSFAAFLLRVGNGIEALNSRNEIQIPASINVPFIDDASSIEALTNMVFPNMEAFTSDTASVINHAILTTRNDFVHEINNTLIDKFPGTPKIYLSFDEPLHTKNQADHHDFLHSLTPKGLPTHELKLKPNCPVMLLRNINPAEGLSNGTRLICKEFADHVIYAKIAFGTFAGKPVFIPRIPLQSPDNEFGSIPFKRTQFPLRLCFAMTINKAQGQTLDFVGLYLKEPVFSHGQLYVALSRAKLAANIKILIRPLNAFSESSNTTKNVVYREVLSTIPAT